MSKMASFRNILFGTAVALTTLTGAAHADAPTTEFQQGLADREAWESWFNGLSGEYRSGAYFWSGQRSLPDPTSCDSLGGEASEGLLCGRPVSTFPICVENWLPPTGRGGTATLPRLRSLLLLPLRSPNSPLRSLSSSRCLLRHLPRQSRRNRPRPPLSR